MGAGEISLRVMGFFLLIPGKFVKLLGGGQLYDKDRESCGQRITEGFETIFLYRKLGV